jgi:hypothetical protein
MQKGAQPTYFREPHIICQRAACGLRAAVWTPLAYAVGEVEVFGMVHGVYVPPPSFHPRIECLLK